MEQTLSAFRLNAPFSSHFLPDLSLFVFNSTLSSGGGSASRPEALLKLRTPPSTRPTSSARSGSLSTFPFDRPQSCETRGFSMSSKRRKNRNKQKHTNRKPRKKDKYLFFYRHESRWVRGSVHFRFRQLMQRRMGGEPQIFLLLTEVKLNWTRSWALKRHHHSDLIWLFDYLWLFHCGRVSLLVQWQWSSVCSMFILFLYLLTYFAVYWN